MDIRDHLEKAREIRRQRVAERRIQKDKRIINAMSTNCKKLQNANLRLQEELQQTSTQQPQSTQDSTSPSPVHRYTDEQIHIASVLYNTSPKAFAIAREHLPLQEPLPHPRTIQRRTAEPLETRMLELTDYERVPDICAAWRKQLRIDSRTRVPIVLAVDAISFEPYLELSEGKIVGLKKEVMLEALKNQRTFELLGADLADWEAWVESHYDAVLTAAFAYHIQPLDPRYPCFVVHWQQKEHGKAGTAEADLLLAIRRRLQGLRFDVVALAADADSSYNTIHEQYLNSHIPGDDYVPLPIGAKTQYPFICDPLHVLKRLRYRLLQGKKFVAGFTHSDNEFDSAQIASALPHVLPVLLEGQEITKMHDSLPIEFFTPGLFLRALDHPVLAAYILPGVLLNVGLNERYELDPCERLEIFLIGYYYMVGYYKEFRTQTWDKGILQVGAAGRTHCLYDFNLMMHLLNTFRALIDIIWEHRDPRMMIGLNRCGSNPLEHYFGKIRLQSHNVHTIITALKCVATNQLYSDSWSWRIPKRASSYGCTLRFQEEEQWDLYLETGRSLGCAVSEYFIAKDEGPVPVHGLHSLRKLMGEYDRCAAGHKQRARLSLSTLTLAVTSGYKPRNLTRSRAETYSLIRHPDPFDPKKLLERELEKMRFSDLQDLSAAVSAYAKVTIQRRIKTKADAVSFLMMHWENERVRYAIRAFFEQVLEARQEDPGYQRETSRNLRIMGIVGSSLASGGEDALKK